MKYVLLLLLLISCTSAMAQDDQRIEEQATLASFDGLTIFNCHNCSTQGQFDGRAWGLLGSTFRFLRGTQRIHLVNVRYSRVYVYDISRIEGNTRSFPPQTILVTDVDRVFDDPHRNRLQDAVDTLRVISTVLSKDLESERDLGVNFASAIDLLGPNDSPAGFRRATLNATVQSRFEDTFRNELAQISGDLRELVSFLTGHQFNSLPVNIDIIFPDDSTIRVSILNSGIDDHNNPTFEINSIASSVRLPNGQPVPQTPGQFGNLNIGGLSRGTALALGDYGRALGLDVVACSTCGGGQQACEFRCDSNNRCTVVLNCN